MKVFWFVNVHVSEIAKELNQPSTYYGGWLHQFRKSISEDSVFELTICSFEYSIDHVVERSIGGINYYVIPKKVRESHLYDASIEKYIEDILCKDNPDVIHVWGTEYPHSLAVAKVSNALKRRVVYSIQGLIGDCAGHYCDGLRVQEIYSFTLRDFLRKDNIYFQKEKFAKRGSFEREVLLQAENVIGRTSYDFAGVKEINPSIHYYACNECLRESFYEASWNIDEAEDNSIFISQADYPIKGFHYFIEGLKIIKENIADVKVYVAGGLKPFETGLSSKIRMGSYAQCIKKRIEKYNLEENIVFLGGLSERHMRDAILKCRVFVSPSLVENSSNSIGEAMKLGVPVVSSYVGGVRDMITDKLSGVTYPVNQPNMMAQMVLSLFKERELSLRLSEGEKRKAKDMFDIEKNTKTMKEIYVKIANS